MEMQISQIGFIAEVTGVEEFNADMWLRLYSDMIASSCVLVPVPVAAHRTARTLVGEVVRVHTVKWNGELHGSGYKCRELTNPLVQVSFMNGQMFYQTEEAVLDAISAPGDVGPF